MGRSHPIAIEIKALREIIDEEKEHDLAFKYVVLEYLRHIDDEHSIGWIYRQDVNREKKTLREKIIRLRKELKE
jgi:hypothetical protein